MTHIRMRLLNPGPVTLSAGVRAALQKPDLCHREPEFAELTLSVRRRLESVYEGSANQYRAILLTGSGTAAVEAMIASLVSPTDVPLVLVNGVYGDRIVKMREQSGRPVEAMVVDWREGIPFERLEQRLIAGLKPSHIVVIQHETTTGRLNDIERLGKLCKTHQVPMLLDGVSSFGAEEIRFEDWNLQAVAATANKCLHGIPGTSFVLVRNQEADQIIKNGSYSPVMYLDLARYARDQEKGFSPFTQSVQALYALDQALVEFSSAGGWRERHADYLARQSRVTSRLGKLGITPFLSDPSSVVLKAFRLGKMSYTELHHRLKATGFTIYSGQGGLATEMFRISTMGDLTEMDICDLEIALEQAFQ